MSERNLDPAKLEQWKRDAETPPPARPAPKGQDDPKVARGKNGGVKTNGKDQREGSEEKTVNLPSDIVAQFPDVDLSTVSVILNSRVAAEKGVQGFASNGTIYVAPGADKDKVMRHEAAHLAQMMKDPDAKQKEGEGEADGETPAADQGAPGTEQHTDVEPRHTLEGQATRAEDGNRMSGDDLGHADSAGEYHSETNNLSEKGLPKVEFNGFTFEKLSGAYEKTLLDAEWDDKKLCDAETWWRIPAFPAAGVYIKAGINFKPEATLKAKGSYSWNKAENKYEVSGTLEGELKAALTGYVEGGIGLNLVIQRGGVGIRASIALEAFAKLSRGISFSVSPTGVNFRMTPLEFEIGAALKAMLTARAWTEGWFWDSATEWTFAEFPIASLTGYKATVAVDVNSRGVQGRVGQVKPGTFAWGGAPACTDQNGHEI